MQRLARRNIHIKRFDNIPMADTEMVFPDKRVYVKPLTLITLFVTIVMGIVACITSALAVRCACSLAVYGRGEG